MQRFMYQIALACLAGFGCAAFAQQAEPIATEPAAAIATTAATVAEPAPAPEPVKTEEQLKEELIAGADHLSDQAKAALRAAAHDMSYKFLQGYMRYSGHHAFDGHSALDHAKLKEKFLPPSNGMPCPDCGKTVWNRNKDEIPAWTTHYTGGKEQYSRFPIPLGIYTPEEEGMGLWDKLCHRVAVDNFNLAATIIFLCAILHTFLAPKFQSLAHKLEHAHKQRLKQEKFRILHPEQRVPVSFASTLCHFLGEVEVVFGLWIIPFALVCQSYYSMEDFLLYIDHDTSFTEPLFVAVVMVIASSRPIYRLAENTLKFGASLGKGTPAAWWLSVLCIAPLLGSFITEPAAMTLAAILLGKKFYQLKPADSLKYATIALLFVNVSVGGTLTHFAAPPIVMVAGKWDWGMGHMFLHFGWKAVVGIVLANVIYFMVFRKEFTRLAEVQRANSAFDSAVPTTWEDRQDIIPVWVYGVSIFFLAWTVYFAHHPACFIGGFMFFLGFTMATPQYQNAFSIKVPMLVAFFLAGLLIMGGVQGWWMQPVLQALSELGATATMGVASVLTAFNDNASVTFLASTVPNLQEEIKYAIVAGAVTGGGLTVIANAPNPAGQAILGKYFKSGISALKLFLWAFLPTTIMFLFFILIR
ncbi:MAG: putative Na+/H+ antiporter [Akkermansia sp.]|nr:putative Na+/H+ antiporter [Akkermansia sp.]